jgi:regulatory protein
MRSRLLRKYPADIADQVVAALGESGLLNDDEFARSWRDSRDRNRPRSGALIKRELLAKGIARDLAETQAQAVDDYDAAHRAAFQHARRLSTADRNEFSHKLRGFLHRRGFSAAVIRKVADAVWEDVTRHEA